MTNKKKIVFVFGAGASYGAYAKDKNVRTPPLTATLFNEHRILQGATKANALISLMKQARAVQGNSFDFEKSLAKLVKSKTPERLTQLMDLRYQIHSIIQQGAIGGYSSIPRKSLSLYEDLWFRVKEYFDSIEVRFINVNYDTILEKGIADSEGIFEDFNAYIANEDWKLYHPHGNISWGYKIPQGIQSVTPSKRSRESILDLAPSTEISDLELEKSKTPFSGEPYLLQEGLIPAIALPLAGSYEKELFVSPDSHIQDMRDQCGSPDILVLIGWRGLDEHILKILKNGEISTKEVHIVSGSIEGAKAIQKTLEQSHFTADSYLHIGGGFEAYLKSPEFSTIFPNPAQ